MARVLFSDPLGNTPIPIDLPTLLDLIAARDETYWNSLADRGHAFLDYYADDGDANAVASLTITMKDGYGFHICVTNYSGGAPRDWHYAVSGDEYQDLTWINQAGERMRLPRALFVRHATAIAVVRHFWQTGGRSEGVTWRHPNEIPWRQFEDYLT